MENRQMINPKILKWSEDIIQQLQWAKEKYNRLILFVAPSGSGKSETLFNINKKIQSPIINVNLELTRLMLDITKRQRVLQFSRLFNEIINIKTDEIVMLDNMEILFDPIFKIEPLQLLKQCSRNKTLIISWNGTVENNRLIYAIPSHPEYKSYPLGDLIVIGLTEN